MLREEIISVLKIIVFAASTYTYAYTKHSYQTTISCTNFPFSEVNFLQIAALFEINPCKQQRNIYKGIHKQHRHIYGIYIHKIQS